MYLGVQRGNACFSSCHILMAAIGSIHWGTGCPRATILLWNTAQTSTNKWRVLSRFKTKIGIKSPKYKCLTNHPTHTNTHIHSHTLIYTHSQTQIYSHTDIYTPHIYTHKHIYTYKHTTHTHSHTHTDTHICSCIQIHTPHTHTHSHALKHRYILI